MMPIPAGVAPGSIIWLAVVLLVCTGCSEQAGVRRTLAQPYRPANLHQSAVRLPDHLRRVAVLPLTAGEKTQSAQDEVSALEPILLAELRKQGAFDLVSVSRDQLRAWTGQPAWREEESLPPSLLTRIHEQTGSDGVLFVHVSAFRAYPPLAVGWRLRLVDCLGGQTHWTVDEVFDAGSVEVIKAAQAYARGQLNQPSVELDSTGVLSSPRRFGQYSAAAAIGTLPHR